MGCCWLEMPVEKGQHELLGLFRGHAFQAVTRAFKTDEFGLHGGGLEFVHDPGGLLIRDVFIGGAMQAEGGGGIGRDPIQRAADDVLLALSAEIAAEEEWQHVFGIHALFVALGEVTGAEEIDHTTDSAALIQISFTFELRDPGGDAEELRQMATG